MGAGDGAGGGIWVCRGGACASALSAHLGQFARLKGCDLQGGDASGQAFSGLAQQHELAHGLTRPAPLVYHAAQHGK